MFGGFGPQALAFFKALDFHQDRAWFQDNKDLYERELRQPMAALVADLTNRFAATGIPLAGDPKRSVLRIHRDVRFSKDKRPYKTNIGATLTRDGSKMSQGLLYLHVAPDRSFAAAGFYQPEPAELAAIRASILRQPERWRAVVRGLDAAGLSFSSEYRLSRLPRGVPADIAPDLAEALRLKSLVVSRPFGEADIHRPDLVETVQDFASSALPLLTFAWAAVDTLRSGEAGPTP